MSRSIFPSGFKDGIIINGVPLTMTNPGDVFFVGNADILLDKNQSVAGVDQAGGGTFQRPFRTLDFAIGQCTAGRGDVIFIKPGHAETYSTATATSDDLTLDIADVAIIGLGRGTSQPTFTLDTTNTTTIKVSAANISIINCGFKANFLSIAQCFTLTTAKHFALIDCDVSDTTAALNFVNVVESTGAANTVDGLYLSGNTASMLGTTFNTFAVLANTARGIRALNNLVDSIDTADEPALLDVGGIVTDILMKGNVCGVLGTTNINIMLKVTGTTSTGFLSDNYNHSLDTSGVQATVDGGYRFANNQHGGAVITQAKVQDPAAEA